MIHTTVCLRPECVQKLDILTKSKSCSRNRMISSLLLGKVRDLQGNILSGFRIRYQPKSPDGLVTIHIFLETDLYEACLDLRKFRKMSLSYILSEAIMAATIIKHDINDNYTFSYSHKSRFCHNSCLFVLKHSIKKGRKKHPG